MIRGAEREYETILGDYKKRTAGTSRTPSSSGVKGARSARHDHVRQDRGERRRSRTRASSKPGTNRSAATIATSAEHGTLQRPQRLRGAGRGVGNAPVKVDSDTISGLGARNIGSAAMSGRIAALDAVNEGSRLTVYVGAASGGVWKSVNGGTTFKPVFDKQPVQSIGAIAIDPKNPKTIWVGTGESWTRNSVSIGDGVYKSTDGGDNWTNMGLKDSERIAKIARRSDRHEHRLRLRARQSSGATATSAASTRPPTAARRWTKVLKGANASTGCSMMSMDRKNPEDDLRRHVGLPPQGLDVPLRRRRPERAERQRLVQDRPTAARRGRSSTRSRAQGPAAEAVGPRGGRPSRRRIRTSSTRSSKRSRRRTRSIAPTTAARRGRRATAARYMVWRPFYFANLIVDPKDENKLYKPDLVAHRQHRRRQELQQHRRRRARRLPRRLDRSREHRPPHHRRRRRPLVLVRRRQSLVEGREPAGLAVLSRERRHGHARTTSTADCRTTARGSATRNIPAASPTASGRTCTAATASGCSPIRPIPTTSTPSRRAATSAASTARRTRSRGIQPLPDYKEGKLRFNWNTPIHMSPTQNGHGLHRLAVPLPLARSRPDVGAHLARPHDERSREAEAGAVRRRDRRQLRRPRCTRRSTRSPSRRRTRTSIWVGTDDGNVQVTRDGGKTWTNVVGEHRRAAEERLGLVRRAGPLRRGHGLRHVRPAHVRRHAAVRVQDHRLRQDVDAARRRRRAGARLRARHQARISSTATCSSSARSSACGSRSTAASSGRSTRAAICPNVAVRDLAIHPRDQRSRHRHARPRHLDHRRHHAAARADAGRAARRTSPSSQASPVVQQHHGLRRLGRTATPRSSAPNPPGDAVITYYQKKRHIFGDLKIEVFDSDGKSSARSRASKRRGLNRVALVDAH